MKTKNYLLIVTALFAMAFTTNAQYTWWACTQIEDLAIQPKSKWTLKTGANAIATGYSGTGYLQWDGGNNMAAPAAADIITWSFTVPEDGGYTVMFRGRRVRGEGTTCPLDAPGDACNDIKTKVNDGEWHKTMIKSSFAEWIWDASVEIEGAGIKPREHLFKAGVTNTLSIAGRSAGVQLDGVVITKFAGLDVPKDYRIQDPAYPLDPTKKITVVHPYSAMKLECTGIISATEDHTSGTLALYPNPCNNIVNISNITEGSTVKLFNTLGTEMAIEIETGNDNDGSFSTSSLTAGIYFVSIDGKVIKLLKK